MTIGVLILDATTALYGKLGDGREILQTFAMPDTSSASLVGLSRSRMRLDERDTYLREVSALATHHFITHGVPNVSRLVMGGEFKFDGYHLDPRLKLILQLVDSSGGERGFEQVTDQCS